jgi:predicted AlkP superfamily pyrophosphatase or phosphodiesterase
MKFKNLLIIVLAVSTISASAQKKAKTSGSNDALPRPKLVVGLVIDQMRWDYLYRFYDRYQQNGFKRMLNDGFSCENTSIDYLPTYTAIGHSTVYTGSVPSIHGIAGNDFIIQATGKTLYCTEDPSVNGVGTDSNAGKMSPRNMLASTITDELKLATNFRSKVIGISIKDRGGILPAGHTADAAYWMDGIGNWISSTYYMQDLPQWVKEFNAAKHYEKYLKQDWNTLYPIETYVQSIADDNKYEGKFSGTNAPTLPVKTSELMAKGTGIIKNTPYGNSITFDLAKAAIENEKLGANVVTDFLAVSLSSPDYIGHQFAPNSVEIEDTYLRLDKELGDFLTFLDNKVGRGNYTFFITSDHGAAHNPVFMKDKRIPAGIWPSGSLRKALNEQLESKFKFANIVQSFSNYQVHLNNLLIEKEKLDEAAIRKACIAFLKKQEGVANAVDMDEIETASITSELKSRIIKGYNRERSGIIQIILNPGWYDGGSTGTTHGTWNPYDAHIPLLWMGWGINQGRSSKPTNMTDISATLAALLRIQAPSGNVGIPIEEVIKK